MHDPIHRTFSKRQSYRIERNQWLPRIMGGRTGDCKWAQGNLGVDGIVLDLECSGG